MPADRPMPRSRARLALLALLAGLVLALVVEPNVLARRLLLAAQGGSAVVADDDPMIVAYLTRLSNFVVTNGDSFPFDTERMATNTTYFTWSGTPGDPLVCQRDGWYNLRGNFTSLGTFYGGASNLDWFAAIGRNGNDLDHMIVAGRHRAGSGAGASADLFEISDDVYLYAGDEITVSFLNDGAGLTTLLVESNPSDGVPSGYLADTGPGTLSPHLIIETRRGTPPLA